MSDQASASFRYVAATSQASKLRLVIPSVSIPVLLAHVDFLNSLRPTHRGWCAALEQRRRFHGEGLVTWMDHSTQRHVKTFLRRHRAV